MPLKTALQEQLIEAGCDEAGRGPLAGPVVAAAVILPSGWSHPLLNDSKKMSAGHRALLRKVICKEAVAWAIEMVMPEEIDKINVLAASFEAMSRAVEKLSLRPKLLLIDGNLFRSSLDIPYRCIVKGDGIYANIAAASVLAKTERDSYMISLSERYPHYGWERNKGYPTPEHREAIRQYGLSVHHRRTFCGNFNQLTLSDLE